MADILLYKVTNYPDGKTIRCKITNFNDLSLSLDQPVSPMALPQESSEENVLVKMEGNTETINLTWNIHDVDSSTAVIHQKTSTSTSGEIEADAQNLSGDSGSTALTMSNLGYYDSNQIVAFLLSSFQGYSIADRYYLAIPKVSGEVIMKEGFVTRINCNVSSNSPVVWQCSVTMLVGNVISIYDADTPSEPRNVAAAQVDNGGDTSGEGGGTATKIRLRWQAPSDTATTIAKYNIYRKTEDTGYVKAYSITDSGLDGAVSSNNAYKEYAVTGLDSGKVYHFKITAENVGGEGLKSEEVSATFP